MTLIESSSASAAATCGISSDVVAGSTMTLLGSERVVVTSSDEFASASAVRVRPGSVDSWVSVVSCPVVTTSPISGSINA